MSEQAYAVVGYIRVSTSEQADSGAGSRRSAPRSRQRQSVEAGSSSTSTRKPAPAGSPERPRRAAGALEAVEEGQAQALVVANSTGSRARSWTSLRSWSALAAWLEPDRPRSRRRYLDSGGRDDGLGARDLRAVRAPADRSENEGRARGEEGAGRPARASARDQRGHGGADQELYESGLSAAAIARKLNEEGVPTPRGGRWHPPA